MATYTLVTTGATYDGTRADVNPDIIVKGTVNGSAYVFSITWHQFWSSYNDEAGVDSVKATFAAIMLNTMSEYRRLSRIPEQQVPVYNGTVPARPSADANLGYVEIPEAVIAAWVVEA